MKCRDCKYWQGTKYDEWADCYRVVASLIPDLESCYLLDLNDNADKFFSVPFDPHDYKYWSLNPYWKTLYNKYQVDRLGVRDRTVIKDDVIFDHEGGERVGSTCLRYFQTHKEYECND